ncbi:hypothetical protein [Desulfurobacterium sp.]
MKSQSLQSLSLIDYPAGRENVILRKLETLEDLDIKLGDFIAKGYRGTVFSGFIKPYDYFTIPIKVAIKFARSDADKEGFLLKEARFLEYLEPKTIAPVVYYYDEDMIIMEYIEGAPFSFDSFSSKSELVDVLKEIIEKCYILDKSGVNHSELKGEKHIIITDRGVKFIDFESARFTDNPRNLLQFLGFHILRKPKRIVFLGISLDDLKSGIELYKENPLKGFRKILSLF